VVSAADPSANRIFVAFKFLNTQARVQFNLCDTGADVDSVSILTGQRQFAVLGEMEVDFHVVTAVCDDIIANGSHDVEVYFHFAEHCKLTLAGENRYRIDVGSGVAEIELDSRLSIEKLEGDENPIGGWVSRGYHRKTASTTLAGRFVSGGEMSLICRIDIGVSGNE